MAPRSSTADDDSDNTISSSLLLGVRQRDADAWRRLVRLYGPLVYQWCKRTGASDDEAADIGQEVFRAVATGIDRFRRDEAEHTFVGWLRTITRNKAADFHRLRAKHPRGVGGSSFQTVVSGIPDAPSPNMAESLSSEDYRTLLVNRAWEVLQSAFEEKTWTAFWLTAIEDGSADDVAQKLGMTAMAVRKAKSRVLRRLRDEFGGQLPDRAN